MAKISILPSVCLNHQLHVDGRQVLLHPAHAAAQVPRGRAPGRARQAHAGGQAQVPQVRSNSVLEIESHHIYGKKI